MAESKYGKYICTELKQGVVMPGFKGPQTIGQGYLDGYRRQLQHVIWMDEEVIPGAFYAECTWQWPSSMPGQRPRIITPETVKKMKEGPGIKPHSHPFIELFCYFGTNMDDPGDPGAEIEFTVDNKTYKITKSFATFVPAGIQHGPLIIRNVKRPIFHFIAADSEKYE